MTVQDDNKQRIIDEEVLRIAVRENAKPKKKPLIAFLNSALGIWFLSSIVLGVISWQYAQYSEIKENRERAVALLSKSKFDLLVLCDIGLSKIEDKTKLSYNDISSTASLFRYEPRTPDERGNRFSIIEVLNKIAELSPNDTRIAEFRLRSYEFLRKANTILDNYRGWQSSSDPNSPIYDIKLSDKQKIVIAQITKLLTEMRTFARNAT